jgi:predicted metal-binding membrane protein
MERTTISIHSWERIVISVALVTLTLLAWSYLITAGAPSNMAMPISMAASGG